ncbi:MAG: KEOPS complex subunit Cgi121 [Candidatus Bathyarchaeia archaeon]
MQITFVEEFRKHIGVAGFKNINLPRVDDLLRTEIKGLEIQFFDASSVATWRHLFFAGLNALRAFSNKENISKSIGTEALLYASTQDQISRAIEIIGVKGTTSKVAVLVIGDDEVKVECFIRDLDRRVGEMDDTVMAITEEKLGHLVRQFNIPNSATTLERGSRRQAVADLIIEAMALLAVRK